QVVDERPYTVTPRNRPAAWIERFTLRPVAAQSGNELDGLGTSFQETFTAVARGAAENDAFNALVLGAGLTWREAAILRTYSHYLRQIGTPFSQDYIAAALLAHPDLARGLVTLFRDRFDPDRARGSTAALDAQVAELTAGLDRVTSLDEDRMIRAL